MEQKKLNQFINDILDYLQPNHFESVEYLNTKFPKVDRASLEEVLEEMDKLNLIRQNIGLLLDKPQNAITITSNGEKIKLDGGWLKHFKQQQNQNKSPHHWSGIGANLATMGVFLFGCYSFYESYNVSSLKSKIETLEKSLEKIQTDSVQAHQEINSLRHLLKDEKMADSTKK